MEFLCVRLLELLLQIAEHKQQEVCGLENSVSTAYGSWEEVLRLLVEHGALIVADIYSTTIIYAYMFYKIFYSVYLLVYFLWEQIFNLKWDN